MAEFLSDSFGILPVYFEILPYYHKVGMGYSITLQRGFKFL